MQASGAPFLSADTLACRRGERLLFRGLSFELSGGEALHLTGANGTGKTTLIRTLAGLSAPFAGAVVRSGAIGLLDDRPALDPELPLGRALEFWQGVDGCPAPEQVVATLGLANLRDVPVRYLSTGQRKRAALATLINRAVPIWLLDEPLSGLDVAAIETVSTLIADHVEAGGIALIASHQPLAIDGLKTIELGEFLPQDHQWDEMQEEGE